VTKQAGAGVMTDVPLKFHPLADIFPLMKGRKFDALVADIKTHGLREPIMLYQGKVLDGRNRYHAYLKAFGTSIVDCEPCTTFEGDDAAALAFVVSKNFYRRHLTAEQRRKVLIDLVAAQPGKSDRAIGREAGVDHKQIGRARRKGESTGAIDPVDKRKGADGRTRAPKGSNKVIDAQGWEWKIHLKKYSDSSYRWRANDVADPDVFGLCSAPTKFFPTPDEARADARRMILEVSSKRKAEAKAGGTDSWNRWQAEAARAAAQATGGAPVTKDPATTAPLVWKKGHANGPGSYYASAGDGSYQICPKTRDGRFVEFCPHRRSKNHPYRTIGTFASLEAAKGGAQADYAKGATAAAPAKPLGKREAKRLAKEQHQEVMRAKGEALARAMIAKDREGFRLVIDIMDDIYSRDAFEEAGLNEFGFITRDDNPRSLATKVGNGKFIAYDGDKVLGKFDSWLAASRAIDASKDAKGTS
jgi:hypothetical protein